MKFEKLKTYQPKNIDEDSIYRASVCIPLIEASNGYEILFEVRSNRIPDQPGDICLPGGGIEHGETSEEAAIRELCEELCLKPSQFELLGPSDIFHREEIIKYPFVGYLKDYTESFNHESEKVFTIPLDYFKNTEPEYYRVLMKPSPARNFPFDRIQGGRNYKWRQKYSEELFYQYKCYNIWGITAAL